MDDFIEKNTTPEMPIQPPKKKKRWLKNIMLILLIVFAIMQAFQPKKNNNDITVANNITSIINMPDTVNKLLEAACYDCHSNNTKYPWYSNIQPAGWWLAYHVKEGKKHLNFNDFSTYPTKKQLKKLEEIKESQEEGWMPLDSYTWMHKDAKLNDIQKRMIINWVDSSITRISSQLIKK